MDIDGFEYEHFLRGQDNRRDGQIDARVPERNSCPMPSLKVSP